MPLSFSETMLNAVHESPHLRLVLLLQPGCMRLRPPPLVALLLFLKADQIFLQAQSSRKQSSYNLQVWSFSSEPFSHTAEARLLP